MKTENTASIKLKDGRFYKKGREFIVIPSVKKPESHALVVPKSGGESFSIPYMRLPAYFNNFHLITQEEIERSLVESICPSITGELINIDAFDSLGFPSWRLVID